MTKTYHAMSVPEIIAMQEEENARLRAALADAERDAARYQKIRRIICEDSPSRFYLDMLQMTHEPHESIDEWIDDYSGKAIDQATREGGES